MQQQHKGVPVQAVLLDSSSESIKRVSCGATGAVREDCSDLLMTTCRQPLARKKYDGMTGNMPWLARMTCSYTLKRVEFHRQVSRFSLQSEGKGARPSSTTRLSGPSNVWPKP